MKFLTATEAAALLKISPQRVRRLLAEGKFPGAVKVGRDWIIPIKSLAAVPVYGKAGRPKGGENGRKINR